MTKAKKVKGEELRRRTMSLACRLTEDELRERRESLVEWTEIRAEREGDLERWKADMKEEKKLYDGEIVTAAAKVQRFARVIKEGQEYRDVEVVDTIAGSTVTSTRTDTGEIVAERAASDSELQRGLNLEVGQQPPDEPDCSCGPGAPAVDCPIHGVMGDE